MNFVTNDSIYIHGILQFVRPDNEKGVKTNINSELINKLLQPGLTKILVGLNSNDQNGRYSEKLLFYYFINNSEKTTEVNNTDSLISATLQQILSVPSGFPWAINTSNNDPSS